MSEAQIQARQDFAIEQNITTLAQPRQPTRRGRTAGAAPGRRPHRHSASRCAGPEQDQGHPFCNGNDSSFAWSTSQVANPVLVATRGAATEPPQMLKRSVIASGDQIIDARAGFDRRPAALCQHHARLGGGESMLRHDDGKPDQADVDSVHRDNARGDSRPAGRIPQGTSDRGNHQYGDDSGRVQEPVSDQRADARRSGRSRIAIARWCTCSAGLYRRRTHGRTELGQDNIDRGFNAIKIGFLAVIIFMAVYYRAFGLIANVALLSNLVFIVAMLSILGASLTLPGIAGIVLTVGMAVDANVLIFERIREELAANASPQAAINAGYEKALSSITDANVTTLIAAVVLFCDWYGADQGFRDNAAARHHHFDVHRDRRHPRDRQSGIRRAQAAVVAGLGNHTCALIRNNNQHRFPEPGPAQNSAVAVGVVCCRIAGSLATRGLDFGIDFTGGILLEVGYRAGGRPRSRFAAALQMQDSWMRRCSCSAAILMCSFACRRSPRRAL